MSAFVILCLQHLHSASRAVAVPARLAMVEVAGGVDVWAYHKTTPHNGGLGVYRTRPIPNRSKIYCPCDRDQGTVQKLLGGRRRSGRGGRGEGLEFFLLAESLTFL